MNIDLKKSTNPIKYSLAMSYLEKRVKELNKGISKELIWILEHPSVFTAGVSYKKEEILDKSINVIETSRGGKITYHGPGQLVCYVVIDLKKRKKDIRKFIINIEKSIIKSLESYGIKTKSDRKNIGIWININGKDKKIGAIGIKVKKWIAFHGFSINIENNLNIYDKIIPCGIKNCEVTNLQKIKKQSYKELPNLLLKNLTKYLKI
tara:strand:- start:335 stop:955 length:621 start_codon:yes stop_codon:yes gene_type:complete